MDNYTRPTPPNVSEGCFNCGGGKDQMLASLLRNSASVALCSKCDSLPPSQIRTQPFNSLPK